MDRRRLLQLGALGAAAMAPSVQGQTAAPVRLLLGFAAGGSADGLTRLLADRLKEVTGRNVVVENRTGAGGRLAIEAVKAAAPDGDTLLVAPNGPMTLFPHIYKSLRYDPIRDFAPITRLSLTDYVLVVSAQNPARDVRSFADWARTQGGAVGYGSPGVGSTPHFLGVQIARALGIGMTHVPYRGSAPALIDLAGGTIGAVMTPITDPMELHKAGKLRILATTGATRTPLLDGIPTLKESGVDVDVSGWYSLYGPAGLPAAQVQKLHDAVAAAWNQPAVQERLLRMGLTPALTSPAELALLQQKETAGWAQVVKASGFTPED